MPLVKTLEILTPGPLTTVQDLGRLGYGRYGVAKSGALDGFSLRIGNSLVGNPEKEAGLEITLMGFKARALNDVLIAVTGGDMKPFIEEKPLQMWESKILKKDEILSFKGLGSGCRAYLTVGGGVGADVLLGSKSTNLSSQFGGYEGRSLKKGDLLASESPGKYLKGAGRELDRESIPAYGKQWILRLVRGPQDGDFTDSTFDVFLNSSFEVKPQSDRTGIRLAGPIIERAPGTEASIISEGVISGAIQIPGDGQPIIILGETVTGGYRKIATVISADLPLLGQLKPGDEVRFQEVSLEEATKALKEMEGKIEEFRMSFRKAI